MILGVIPARGQSKTIARKNLYPLNGVPLIEYTIRAAKASRLDDFIVTTDDDEIAAYAEGRGCKVIHRPAELAQDDTPMVPVVQHAVVEYERQYEKRVQRIVLLQPTSPLRRTEHIDGAVDALKTCWSVVSVCHGTHPVKAYIPKPTGYGWKPALEAGLYDKHLHHCLVRNGAIFGVNRNLLDSGKLMADEPMFMMMSKLDSVDLDDMEDIGIAAALLEAMAAHPESYGEDLFKGGASK